MLSREEFSSVVRLTPLVAIDLILRDPDGRTLVGLRNNEPAKGTWFVPGGTIRKDERLEQAFARIMTRETGLAIPFSDARLIGVYQHFYVTNRYGEPGYGTHYVVLGYELRLDHTPDIVADEQHSAMRWTTPAEILTDPAIHENTKAYFR